MAERSRETESWAGTPPGEESLGITPEHLRSSSSLIKSGTTCSVSVGLSTNGLQEAFVVGRDYRDVLHKIAQLRELALQGLQREEGSSF